MEGNSKHSEENLVKKTCKELGVTQKELAEMLGVSQDTVSNWTKGKPKKIIEVLLESLVYRKKFQEVFQIIDLQIKPLQNKNFL